MLTSELEQNFLVTDSKNIPLLTLPFSAILRQKQFYRLVAVALLSFEGHLFLRKRFTFPYEQKKNEYWGLPVLAVQQNQSCQEVTEKIVEKTVGLFEVTIHYNKTFQLPQWHNFHGTFSKIILPKGITPIQTTDSWLYVDKDELEGLVAEIPEMVAPETLWALEQNIIFNNSKTLFKTSKAKKKIPF